MAKPGYNKVWYLNNKEHCTIVSKRWADSNKNKVKIIKQRYRDAHVDRVRAASRKWSKDNKLQRLNARFNKEYGITFAEYSLMVIEQLGCCFICKLPTYELVVDHNHKANRVRRLLCGSCNRGIGLLRDSPELCEAAAVYLREYSYA